MVCYLLSDLASEVTGQIYTVNAGRIAVWNQPIEVREMRKDGRWTRRRDRVALRRGRSGADADPRAPAGDGSRGQGEGQAQQLTTSDAPARSATWRVSVTLRVVDGITLRAGKYEATFRPDAAMLCASLRFRDDEYVAWPRTDRRVPRRARHRDPARAPVGEPARGRELRRGRRHASTSTGLTLPHDPNGLPIHGNLFGAPFEVQQTNDTRVVARLDYGAHPEKLRAFPFPHTLTVDARLHPTRGLNIVTQVEPTSDQAGADLVRLASVRPTPERAPRRMGAALARVRARRGRRPRHPDRRAHAASRATRTDRRPHLRRPLRTRAATARSRSRPAPGAQPPHAHAAVRPRVSVRAAVRPARTRVRRDRTDDGRDRRARARHRARSSSPATASRPRSTSRSRRADAQARSRRADAGVR